MSSLFQISSELDSIFYEIEENGGEITPEIEEKLALTQDNFREKVGRYVEAIKSLDSDIDSCKKEKDRVMSYSKSKTLAKERLSKALITAIMNYGDTNAKGNKFVDLTTGKAQVRESKTIELDEVLISAIVASFMKYVKWYNDNDQLAINSFDIEHVLSFINEDLISNVETQELLISYYDNDKPVYYEITEDDLMSIELELKTDCPLTKLFEINGQMYLQGYFALDWLSSYKHNIDKTIIKNRIINGDNITIAKIKTNYNLNIK